MTRRFLPALIGSVRALLDLIRAKASAGWRAVAAWAAWVREVVAWLALVAWGLLPWWGRMVLALTVGLPVLLWIKAPRWGRLFDYYAVVGVLYWWFNAHPPSPEDDVWTLFAIGTIYALVWLVMVAGTHVWTGRGLGLLGTAHGDALVYLTASSAALTQVPDLPREAISLGRANFYAGGGLLLVMVLRYMVVTRGLTRTFFPDDDGDGAEAEAGDWRDALIEEQARQIEALEAQAGRRTRAPSV